MGYREEVAPDNFPISYCWGFSSWKHNRLSLEFWPPFSLGNRENVVLPEACGKGAAPSSAALFVLRLDLSV